MAKKATRVPKEGCQTLVASSDALSTSKLVCTCRWFSSLSRSQHPFDVPDHGKGSTARVFIVQTEQRMILTGSPPGLIKGTKTVSSCRMAVAVVFVDGIALPVTRPVGGSPPELGAPWESKRSGFLVADVDDFGLGIAYGIVLPWGQAIGLAVSKPGETETGFGHDRSEVRRGDDIRPRRRRSLAGFEVDGVFTAVPREAAETVEVGQLQEGQFRGTLRIARAAAGSEGKGMAESEAAASCCVEVASSAAQHRVGGGE